MSDYLLAIADDLNREPPLACDGGDVAGAMTEAYLGDGIWAIRDGRVGLFYGRCEEGCSWTLAPDYRRGVWVVQHGANREHVRVLSERSGPFDPRALLDRLADWLDAVHAYEAIGVTTDPRTRRDAGGGMMGEG